MNAKVESEIGMAVGVGIHKGQSFVTFWFENNSYFISSERAREIAEDLMTNAERADNYNDASSIR